MFKRNRPGTLKDALMKCCSSSFSNIYTQLNIFGTIILRSCSCERSASALRRLNNYLRCSQMEQMLSTLALIHMNYDTDIDIESISMSVP